MIIEIPTTKQVNVQYIKLSVPVRYDDEDIPYDFPLRNGDIWQATINLDTHKIENWPQGKSGRVFMKVCDEGSYYLLDDNQDIIKEISDCYVPDCIPNKYGDYVNLHIDETGKIINMPTDFSFERFFTTDDDE